MRDPETGNVTCDFCGAYLGNYLTGDYYRLIKMRFCPACKVQADRQRKAFWAKEKRRADRREKAEMKSQLERLQAENDALRRQIIEERYKV